MKQIGAACCLLLLLTALPLGAEQRYELVKGDTLYGLSRRFEVPVSVLQAYNLIKDPSSLRTGTVLRIPLYYRVRKGDTLYAIARQHGVGLAELTRLNGIDEAAALKVGRKLFLPSGAKAGQEAQLSAAARASAAKPLSPAPAAAAAKPAPWFWPHPGQREALSGRITGAVIYGDAGDRVVSVSSGRVVWVGPYRGFSRVVLIESENGYTWVYGGNEQTLVAVGDRVRQGTQIGLLGRNAHQGIPQLYFLVYRDGIPVDPSQAPRS